MTAVSFLRVAMLCSAAIVFAGVRPARAADDPSPQQAERIKHAREPFERAHAALGNGVRFDAETCAAAMPLLEQSLSELKDLPQSINDGHNSPYAYAALMLAHCLLLDADDEGISRRARMKNAERAAELLRAGADTRSWDDVIIRAEARTRLADLYRTGRGVAVDHERALMLYLLGDTQSEPERSDSRRHAADLMLELKGSDKDAYALLESGRARNWLHSVDLRTERNENRYDIVRVMIAATGVASASDDEDRAALAEMRRRLGVFFSEQGSLPAALHYLRGATGAADREGLERDRNALMEKIPYRLLGTDGQEQGVFDEAP